MIKKIKTWLEIKKMKALFKKERKFGIPEKVKELTRKHRAEALKLEKLL